MVYLSAMGFDGYCIEQEVNKQELELFLIKSQVEERKFLQDLCTAVLVETQAYLVQPIIAKEANIGASNGFLQYRMASDYSYCDYGQPRLSRPDSLPNLSVHILQRNEEVYRHFDQQVECSSLNVEFSSPFIKDIERNYKPLDKRMSNATLLLYRQAT